MNGVITDVIDRPIEVGDFVYYYSHLYEVKKMFPVHSSGSGGLKLMIHPASRTSKNKDATGRECCLIPKEELLLWMLKKEHK